MIIYPIHDFGGRVIGSISLENDTITDLIMNNQAKFSLGGAWTVPDKQFMNFYLVPEPFEESLSIMSSIPKKKT